MQNKFGFFSTIGAFLSGIIAWAQRHDSELRAFWLLLAIFISLCAAGWWLKKWIIWLINQFRSKDRKIENQD